MNRLGMIVDVAHATEQVTRDVVDITSQPIILSHTALRRTPRKYTRYIYADHARLIASTAASSASGPPAAAAWNDGPGVSGGSPTWSAPSTSPWARTWTACATRSSTSTGELPDFAAALLAAGFSKSEAAGILGGNFMRVFRAVAQGS